MSQCACGMSWVKFGLLAALAGGGAVGGLYLSGGLPFSPLGVSPPTQPVSEAPPEPSRFPMSALDVKDTLEAPELAADSTGRVFLTWGSKTGDAERTVFITRTIDGGHSFDAPKAVSKAGVYKTPGHGKSGGHERRATPHLAPDGDKLHLGWSEALADGSAMRMVLATSTDAGQTFGAPQPVHQGESAKPAFTAMAFGQGGAIACCWLDERSGTQQVYASVRPTGATAFNPELLVHPGQPGKGVCPCCPTAAAFSPDGTLYVAFRNINDGYRDIAVSRLRPGQSAFEGPFLVMEKTWKFDGCPHDGPSIAVIGDTVHVAWMDARSGPQRCYHAKAKLADMKFEARELHACAAGTQGNPKLHADAAGNLHAVWEASIGTEPAAEGAAGHQHGPPKVGGTTGRSVHYATIPAGQTAFSDVRAIAPKPGAFQTRPTVVATTDGNVFVAWNELDTTGKSVVVTRLPAATEGTRQ